VRSVENFKALKREAGKSVAVFLENFVVVTAGDIVSDVVSHEKAFV